MKRNFDKIYERKNTNCFKWDLNKERYDKEDVIPMWVADMDLPTDPLIEQSIIDRAKHPLYGYTFRDDNYYQAFINWQKTHNNWNIEKDWLLNSTSVVVSINLIIRTLSKPEDSIMILTPVYSQFFTAVEDTGRKMISSSLIEQNSMFVMDYNDIETKLAQGVKILIFCSPHNPVGRVWSMEELLKLTQLCIKYNTIIISDEIHSDLIYTESVHIPVASISPEVSACTITCMSPGKTFNISGLSISFIICENEEFRDKIRNTFLSYHLMAANIFGITAAQTAYSKGASWLQETIKYLESNREHIIEYLSENIPLIKMYKPQGTYLAWLDMRDLELNQDELQLFLVHTAGLGLDNGTKFGTEGEGFMRLNFACSRKLLDKALCQLNSAVNKLIEVGLDYKKLNINSQKIDDCD